MQTIVMIHAPILLQAAIGCAVPESASNHSVHLPPICLDCRVFNRIVAKLTIDAHGSKEVLLRFLLP